MPDAARPDRHARYLRFRSVLEDPFVELDLSLGGLADSDVTALQAPLGKALQALHALEAGGIANADEKRMVGHFWLRAPGLAPSPDVEEAIARTIASIEAFVQGVHSGRLTPPEGGAFTKVVLCGIGGSALGPMLLADVFGSVEAPMSLCVLDNTDPEGIDLAIERLGALQDALVIVISKSGGTPETRNGMLEVERACKLQGLAFAPRAVAVTLPGSQLQQRAEKEGWLATFPIWDWVGGRTSITSAVGLLPGALLGMDVRAFLAGAAAMDDATRRKDVWQNPAAMMAVFWHREGRGKGERAMVVLPYKDRLLLLSRYLQQLVMESLGKEHDRKGRVVNQGITVYGNKGSTDQHAYVQQLRDGRHDFFAVFVRVLQDRGAGHFEVEPGITSGDYLDGLWQGTRAALFDKGRHSATIGVDRLDERVLGALVALFERAVALYAELIDVNAYHQPGVEAGKKAAAQVLELQKKLLLALTGEGLDVKALATKVGADPADCWPVLQHLAANRPEIHAARGHDPATAVFQRRGG
ncbi:MAG TPA: glucose-6-phosphate isomerase [Planctomycetota bacterium]|nr:glucose-6-phosphate isomerase [Planctomycetota bacterium]